MAGIVLLILVSADATGTTAPHQPGAQEKDGNVRVISLGLLQLSELVVCYPAGHQLNRSLSWSCCGAAVVRL